MSNDPVARRAALAAELARQTGEVARTRFRAGVTVDFKDGHDPVTEVDRRVEEMIRDGIAAAFPEDAVLGEEAGGSVGAGFTWVIDPIDGTGNFAAGIAHWCVSIGLLQNGEPVAAAIQDPCAGESFTARRGAGAQMNGAPIHCRKGSGLAGAIIGLGLTAKADPGETFAAMGAALEKGAALRMQGAGALTLAHAAAGRLDGFCERVIFIWDVAAAAVILREAGGFAEFDWSPEAPQDGFRLVAGAAWLLEPLRSLFGAPAPEHPTRSDA